MLLAVWTLGASEELLEVALGLSSVLKNLWRRSGVFPRFSRVLLEAIWRLRELSGRPGSSSLECLVGRDRGQLLLLLVPLLWVLTPVSYHYSLNLYSQEYYFRGDYRCHYEWNCYGCTVCLLRSCLHLCRSRMIIPRSRALHEVRCPRRSRAGCWGVGRASDRWMASLFPPPMKGVIVRIL